MQIICRKNYMYEVHDQWRCNLCIYLREKNVSRLMMKSNKFVFVGTYVWVPKAPSWILFLLHSLFIWTNLPVIVHWILLWVYHKLTDSVSSHKLWNYTRFAGDYWMTFSVCLRLTDFYYPQIVHLTERSLWLLVYSIGVLSLEVIFEFFSITNLPLVIDPTCVSCLSWMTCDGQCTHTRNLGNRLSHSSVCVQKLRSSCCRNSLTIEHRYNLLCDPYFILDFQVIFQYSPPMRWFCGFGVIWKSSF